MSPVGNDTIGLFRPTFASEDDTYVFQEPTLPFLDETLSLETCPGDLSSRNMFWGLM